MKRPILLAIATSLYLVAAWSVAPGFYDGFTPPQPYNWTSPPPQAAARRIRLELVILVFIIRCVLIGCEETGSTERVDGLPAAYCPLV